MSTNQVSSFFSDILGRDIATLVDERQDPGEYRVQWEARGIAAGVYYCRLQNDHLALSRALVYLK